MVGASPQSRMMMAAMFDQDCPPGCTVEHLEHNVALGTKALLTTAMFDQDCPPKTKIPL